MPADAELGGLAAVCRSRSGETENGEQGAAPTRTTDPGVGSWNRSTASAVAASTASTVSTTESGGSPPAEAPRSIEPRVGEKRRPTVRAASTVAASWSPPSRGCR